jgi:cold shock CspA family protein
MGDIKRVNLIIGKFLVRLSSYDKITLWNDEKGFGFVPPLKDEAQIFIHISAFNDRKLRPEINQKVTYEFSIDKQGRKSAVKIAWISDRKMKKQSAKNSFISVIIAITFLIIASSIIFIKQVSFLILYAYVIAQNFFRHKSKKQPFRMIFWLSVVVNINVFIWLVGGSDLLMKQITFYL